MRYLKGHGTDYAFDASTWAHYRRERLNNLQLFKVGDTQRSLLLYMSVPDDTADRLAAYPVRTCCQERIWKQV